MNKIKIILIFVLATSLFSCKKYLDINQNPNVAADADVTVILPSAQAAVGTVLGNQFQINGSFWAQHWTQSPLANQYKIYDQYRPSSDDYNRSWRNLYSSALTDLQKTYDKAKTGSKKQYMAVARILQAYTFQLASDAWGNIPFSEALKATATSTAGNSPKYDDQKDVYTGILKMLDEADTLIDENDPVHPGSDDLIYGGHMDLWLKFSNTLRLRIGMRLSEKDPTWAQAILAKVDPDNLITNLDEEARINYTSAGGNENPLYSEMIGLSSTKNIYGSATCIDLLNSNNDFRVAEFYLPAGNGTVTGIAQGNYNNSSIATGKSIGGFRVAADPDDAESALAPVRFLSGYEANFLAAEAAARGWLTTTATDQDLFEEGIRQNFQAYGLTATDADDYIADTMALISKYPSAGTLDQKIESIITQKWIAMCGNQGFEAWTEWRRTGYPNIFTYSLNGLTSGAFPRRFLYPTDEVNLNSKFPGTKQVTEKVWWDIN